MDAAVYVATDSKGRFVAGGVASERSSVDVSN